MENFMPKKMKLNLEELNVKSFSTSLLRGGVTCEESVSSCGPGTTEPDPTDNTTGSGSGSGGTSGDATIHCHTRPNCVSQSESLVRHDNTWCK